jgi:S-adenosylmethionine:tRNA ribosyltransferase-isomerase
MGYSLKDFDIHIPGELIAQHPATRRQKSRLLVYDLGNDTIRDDIFNNIGSYINSSHCVVYNDTKVINARLFGHKQETGGKVEVLLTRKLAPAEWHALVNPARRVRPGTVVQVQGAQLTVIESGPGGMFKVRFDRPVDFADLDRMGTVPLPKYIRREAAREDRFRYQTVYAARPGSVAAPTAGLHFTPGIFRRLRRKGVLLAPVTLQVGWGTFTPVREEDYREHSMHVEEYEVPESTAQQVNQTRGQGKTIVCVGTTTVRTLETAADRDGTVRAGGGETSLYIYPGYRFKITQALITNFHMPDSSLILMVSAFAGKQKIERAYRHAVAERYRFFSYGDAMLLMNPVK